jgi:hypothetical protein
MLYSPWVPEPTLDQALRYALGQDILEDSPGHELARFLDEHEVHDRERKNPQFRTSVSLPQHNHPFRERHLHQYEKFLLGLRELRGEIVSRLNGTAMEVLGFQDTPESQFRDQSFVKSQHAGFVDLLNENKFLGMGDNYLRSDQIVKVRSIGYYCPYLN